MIRDLKVKDEGGEGGEGGKIYLLAEVMEKGLDASLSKSADRDGAFPFCVAIDSRHEPILCLGRGQSAVGGKGGDVGDRCKAGCCGEGVDCVCCGGRGRCSGQRGCSRGEAVSRLSLRGACWPRLKFSDPR